ncbi:MAG: vanillate O-demethylase oxidoreductase VanB [Gemmatimonas sp.]|nr:vanillate O-demethylase oxidoreductase VanB [Gemmatimonas sp.]
MSIKAQEAQGRPNTDRIEKRLELRASRSRVWRAITTAEEFGAWFRMNINGEFAEGGTVRGRVTHPGYEHVTVEMLVERIEPERYFSYRWHPYAVDTQVDYSAEPTTLVEFIVEETEGGTAVTIIESGFDRIPLARRDEAFRMNDSGWAGQIKNLERYVS